MPWKLSKMFSSGGSWFKSSSASKGGGGGGNESSFTLSALRSENQEYRTKIAEEVQAKEELRSTIRGQKVRLQAAAREQTRLRDEVAALRSGKGLSPPTTTAAEEAAAAGEEAGEPPPPPQPREKPPMKRGVSWRAREASVKIINESEAQRQRPTYLQGMPPPEQQQGSRTSEGEERWEGDVSPKITLICDLDGTVLPGPRKDAATGKVVHPTLAEGGAFAAIQTLLNDGGSIVGVTGGKMGLQRGRFWDCLPLQARKEGRALLFCETGMVLYRADDQTGEPVEDEVSGGEE